MNIVVQDFLMEVKIDPPKDEYSLLENIEEEEGISPAGDIAFKVSYTAFTHYYGYD